VAAKLDRLESILRRVGERVGWPQAWLQEFVEWRGDPRMTLEEFYVRFTLKRIAAEPRFAAVKTEADALAFYRDEDYMLWRNLVHRRHSAWRRVLVTMRGCRGNLLEVGCGIAPISAYCAERKPEWDCWLYDLPSLHFDYGQWRVARRKPLGMVALWPDEAQVVTLIDVLEHLADPLAMAERAVKTLRPNGYLHFNFIGNDRQNDLDLASPEQRDATVAYLYKNLRLVWEKDGYRVSQKS